MKKMKKLTIALIGTICLTLAVAAPATAGTITETTDFSTDEYSPTILPNGIDTVFGIVSDDLDLDWVDAFSFQNIAAGDYTLTFSTDGFTNTYLWLLSSPIITGSNVFIQDTINSPYHFTLTAPGSVTVAVELNSMVMTYYSVTIAPDAPSGVPEPSTFLLGAAGLAGALALHRKRRA